MNKGLALGVPAIMLGLQLSAWIAFPSLIRAGYGDFRAFYAAGYMIHSGSSQYLHDYAAQKLVQDTRISSAPTLPFNHLAYEALLFAPFSRLTYPQAWVAFLVCNLALLGICFRLLRPYLENLTSIWKWLPEALFVSSIPIAAALMQGQDSILLLALLTGAFVALDKNRESTAGALIGVGLFKFQIMLPIALLFLLWRRGRVVAGFALSSSAAVMVSFWLLGFAGVRTYFHSLMATAAQADQFVHGVYPGAMPNLRGLAFGLHLPTVGLIVLSGVVLLVAVCAKPRLEIAILVAALVSYHFLLHDMSILLVPAGLALNRGSRTAGFVLAAPALMVFPPSYFYLASFLLLALFCEEVYRNSALAHRLAEVV